MVGVAGVEGEDETSREGSYCIEERHIDTNMIKA
jgi:hypothetical protein